MTERPSQSAQAGRDPGFASVAGPGRLSIVVQGSVYSSTIVETANHCGHWRRLFPGAQIILAIAITDILLGRVDEERVLRDVRLVPHHRHNGLLQCALRQLQHVCDLIVLSEGALPLPPIKFDAKSNHINLQIVAAKAGMALATGDYTLRVRSDFIFHDDEFITFYLENHDLPRRARNAFRQRVLISQLFTLNPFTLERMPFHFSDWFHFGLTTDVRSIWDIETMSLSDGSFYNSHPHAPFSNVYERRFRVRVAVEQHIAFGSLRRRFPDLVLSYHNDPTDACESINILLNDFVICDMTRCHVEMRKYTRALTDPNMELLCLTHAQWRDLIARGDGTIHAEYFAKQARQARTLLLIREEPILRPVKYAIWTASYLARTSRKIDRFANGLIRSARTARVGSGVRRDRSGFGVER